MKTSAVTVAAALLIATFGGQAGAALIIDVSQVGGNVVATGSGTIDLTGLINYGPNSIFYSNAGTIPDIALIYVGPSGTLDAYGGASGPTSFGTLFYEPAPSSGTGDIFGVQGNGQSSGSYIDVPAGYVSGSPLSGSMTYDNTTIASLGLTPGTYTYTWGSGPDADSLTVNIASVPEPSSLIMAGAAALAGLGLWIRRRGR
jgi:hypothetical protein